jgi:hypothetical protein|tara:strand:+ start:453 stop:680 length:228 start_codon:yes stop_codon:yes gene_type:complete
MTFEVTQRTFNTTGARLERTITVKTNGGQVTIEASFDGVDWQLTDTIRASGGYVVFQGKSMLRITPAGGAEYDYI